MHLSIALAHFLDVDRAPATNATYRKDLGKMVDALGPARAISRVTPEDLTSYLSLLRARTVKYADHPRRPPVHAPLSPATFTKIFKSIRAFFNWCVGRGYISQSPAASVSIRRYYRPPGSSKAIPPQDLSAMIAFARTKRINRERDLAILLFLADTGCRVGGCASLTLDNLHISAHTALLTEKGNRPHRAFFGPRVALALRHWLQVRPLSTHTAVWLNQYGVPLAANGIAIMVRRIAISATGRSIGPHAIRHRLGQAWANAGINPALIALKLGHSDVSTTLHHYFNQDYQQLLTTSQALSLAALQDDQSCPAPPPVPSNVLPFPVPPYANKKSTS